MGLCKIDVTPLLTHWSYVFLVLTHRYDNLSVWQSLTPLQTRKQSIRQLSQCYPSRNKRVTHTVFKWLWRFSTYNPMKAFQIKKDIHKSINLTTVSVLAIKELEWHTLSLNDEFPQKIWWKLFRKKYQRECKTPINTHKCSPMIVPVMLDFPVFKRWFFSCSPGYRDNKQVTNMFICFD